jgi:MFS family permease
MAATGLGRNFRLLWTADSVSTLGDGMVAAAAPLLVAAVSDDPVLVGLAVFVQQLPWPAFSLVSGVVVDRIDKQRLIAAVDAGRGALTAVLAVAVWSGHASIPVIYELRGRVQSAFMMFALGGNVVGALLGGPLVRWYGVTAPFWFSAVAMTLLTAVAWRPFGRDLEPGCANPKGAAVAESA